MLANVSAAISGHAIGDVADAERLQLRVRMRLEMMLMVVTG